MKASKVWLRPGSLRGGCSLALAIGALTALTAQVQAAELDPITVSTPIVKQEWSDVITAGPIKDTTVNARIDVDMDTLKNHSGVVLLKDRVAEAATKACFAANPVDEDDGSCIHNAIANAKPQVAAVIARARAMG